MFPGRIEGQRLGGGVVDAKIDPTYLNSVLSLNVQAITALIDQQEGFPFAKLLRNFCGTKRKIFLSLCISFA